MFEFLSGFNKILVTGPQRSGTTICGKMIAQDLGMKYVDEDTFKVFDIDLFEDLINDSERLVIQCPGLCHIIHLYGRGNIAIVFMKRDIKDIIASQERIHWPKEKGELTKYEKTEGIISKVKYDFWHFHQKDKINFQFEIEYSSLKSHPLWIPKDKRINFKPKQTKIKENEKH
jgi:hypothetical protein